MRRNVVNLELPQLRGFPLGEWLLARHMWQLRNVPYGVLLTGHYSNLLDWLGALI